MQVGVAFAWGGADGLTVARANRAAWHLLEVLGHGIADARLVLVDTHADADAGAGQIAGFDVVLPAMAARMCDLVIAVETDMPLAAIAALRARGGRYVLFLPENPYARWVDEALFAPATPFGQVQCHDAVWTCDTFGDQARLLHTLYRCPVALVPPVWSASLIGWHDRVHGTAFALPYAPRAGGMLRCVIDAPNTSPRAMGVLPLLAIERFHRERRGAVARVEFRHGRALVGHVTFEHLAGGLDVHRQGLLTIWADQDLYAFLPVKADVVVTHSLDGTLRHELLDTLFGGYPLVHNLPALYDSGHFYPDCDLDQAVRGLCTVLRANPAQFAARLADQRARLARFDVANRANVDAYRRAVHLTVGG